jgi:hypothetical protein
VEQGEKVDGLLLHSYTFLNSLMGLVRAAFGDISALIRGGGYFRPEFWC